MDNCGDDCEVLVQLKKAPKVHTMRGGGIIKSIRKRLNNALSGGEDREFPEQECIDALDYTLCGYLMNMGQCVTMSSLAAFGIWIPCPATCNTCCGDSNFNYCWLIKYTFIPSCILWMSQCRASCNLCWLPPGIGIGR